MLNYQTSVRGCAVDCPNASVTAYARGCFQPRKIWKCFHIRRFVEQQHLKSSLSKTSKFTVCVECQSCQTLPGLNVLLVENGTTWKLVFLFDPVPTSSLLIGSVTRALDLVLTTSIKLMILQILFVCFMTV